LLLRSTRKSADQRQAGVYPLASARLRTDGPGSTELEAELAGGRALVHRKYQFV
jgi:hypothetical protein